MPRYFWTAIEVGPMSRSKALGQYLCNRFPVMQFVPLAVFIAAAGLAPAPPGLLSEWAVAAALALILVLQFRLWDDIADRERDRISHPERILCQTRDIKPFLIAALSLSVLSGLLLAWYHGQNARSAAYLLLCATLFAWYRLRPAPTAPGLLNSMLILLKYPGIAWLVSTPGAAPGTPLLISCLFSVYLIFIIFEILDDHSLRQLAGAISSLLASFGLLLCVWVFIAFWTRPHAGQLPWVAWSLIMLGTLTLGLSDFLKLRDRKATSKGRGFFLVGLLAYLTVAIERSP